MATAYRSPTVCNYYFKLKTNGHYIIILYRSQGLKWIRRRFGQALLITNPNKRDYLDVIEGAVKMGETVLLENVEETLDAVLDNVLSRTTVSKGRAIKIGDKEVDLHPDFRLILLTKLANPHYKPEFQAQLTLINFAVTKDG